MNQHHNHLYLDFVPLNRKTRWGPPGVGCIYPHGFFPLVSSTSILVTITLILVTAVITLVTGITLVVLITLVITLVTAVITLVPLVGVVLVTRPMVIL